MKTNEKTNYLDLAKGISYVVFALCCVAVFGYVAAGLFDPAQILISVFFVALVGLIALLVTSPVSALFSFLVGLMVSGAVFGIRRLKQS